MFPCLCIYDKYEETKGWCCISCFCCHHCCLCLWAGKRKDSETPEEENETEPVTEEAGNECGPENIQETPEEDPTKKTSLIQRILLAYYKILHMLWWPLLVASTVAF
jgi:hypothetical protein